MDWAATWGSVAAGLRLAAACAIYWDSRAHFAEARARMTELLERCDPDPQLRAEVLVALELMALDGADVDAVVLDRSQSALEEGLALAAGPSASGSALVGQALLARRRGEALQAEDLVRGWLAEVGEESIVVADALEILAGALADVGEHADPARLFGAGDAVRHRSGVARWGADEPGYQADLQLVREAIGREAFAVAWEKGAALSTGEALAFATRGRGRRGRPTKGWESLTPTELDVVRLVAQGLTNLRSDSASSSRAGR